MVDTFVWCVILTKFSLLLGLIVEIVSTISLLYKNISSLYSRNFLLRHDPEVGLIENLKFTGELQICLDRLSRKLITKLYFVYPPDENKTIFNLIFNLVQLVVAVVGLSSVLYECLVGLIAAACGIILLLLILVYFKNTHFKLIHLAVKIATVTLMFTLAFLLVNKTSIDI